MPRKKKQDDAMNDCTEQKSRKAKDGKTSETQEASSPRSEKFIHQFLPFAFCILTLLFIVSAINASWLGLFGAGVHWVFFGMLGYGAYGLPLILLHLAFFWDKYVDRRISARKVLEAFLMLVCLSSLISISVDAAKGLLDGLTPNVKILVEKGNSVAGGGLLGGLLAYGSYRIFNLVGTIIVIGAIFIALLTLYLGITPQVLIEKAKKTVRERREQLEIKRVALLEDKKKQEELLAFADVEEPDLTDEIPAKKKKKKATAEEESDNDDFFDFSPIETRHPAPIAEKPVRRAKRTFPDGEPTPTDRLVASERKFPFEDATRFEREEEKESGPAEFLPPITDDEVPDLMAEEDKKTAKEETVFFPEEESTQEGTRVIDEDPWLGESRKPVPAIPASNGVETPAAEYSALGAKRIRAESITEDESEYEGDDTEEVIDSVPAPEEKPYRYPPFDLLAQQTHSGGMSEEQLREKMDLLEDTLHSFRINIREMSYSCGPTITRYEVKPEAGIRAKAIANLTDEISMSMGSAGIRVEVIPKISAVGIEVPNQFPEMVRLRGLLESDKFRDSKRKITACLGADVVGNPIIFDIAKMPHLLIAGTTGSGKSVCINSIIMSLLYKATPDEVKLVMIDPKKVEFNVYKGIPHLFSPIVSDPKKAAAALLGAVKEMERRYDLIEEAGVRNIDDYNLSIVGDPEAEYLPYIVIIIDELADLMYNARDEVEKSIATIAAKARAAGIHLIVGTQRPSVDVISGVIKNNIPSRIAFMVASLNDSRTILDTSGAEKLIGNGDMLFAPSGAPKSTRAQGAYVSEDEVEAVVDFLKKNNAAVQYNERFLADMEKEERNMDKKGAGRDDFDGVESEEEGTVDPKFWEAVELALDCGKISTSLMQRRISVGFGRAARIIDKMEAMGIVSCADGNKPRDVLISRDQYAEMRMRGIGE